MVFIPVSYHMKACVVNVMPYQYIFMCGAKTKSSDEGHKQKEAYN